MFHSVGVYPLSSSLFIFRLSSPRKKLTLTGHHPSLSKVIGMIFVMSVTPVIGIIFSGVPIMDTKALTGNLSYSISHFITGSSIDNSYVKTIPAYQELKLELSARPPVIPSGTLIFKFPPRRC